MHQPLNIVDVGNGVHAIDTYYVRPLMDASHLMQSAGRAAFVDVGTSLGVSHLLNALDHLGIAKEQVDYLFITHIHLDHAGGTGTLLEHLPNAQVVLHPKAGPHMIDPEKIINGTRMVYGAEAFDALYGEVKAVPEDRVIIVNEGDELTFGDRRLLFMDTPGHALHHYSMWDQAHNALFPGDTFGLSYRELDTEHGPFMCPTTTPTQFDPDAAYTSFDRLAELGPEAIYLAHYSRVTYTPKLRDDLHRRLDGFVRIAKANEGDTAGMQTELTQFLSKELKAHGFDGDDDRLTAVLGPDLQLSAMGMDMWLMRLRKAKP